MYCTNCGTQRPVGRWPCPTCGMPAKAVQPHPTAPAQIPTYLTQSILVTICCCVPFGIPAIIYSAQVSGKLQAGDVNGAIDASNKAKMWAWISFAAGAVVGALYFLGALASGFE